MSSEIILQSKSGSLHPPFFFVCFFTGSWFTCDNRINRKVTRLGDWVFGSLLVKCGALLCMRNFIVTDTWTRSSRRVCHIVGATSVWNCITANFLFFLWAFGHIKDAHVVVRLHSIGWKSALGTRNRVMLLDDVRFPFAIAEVVTWTWDLTRVKLALCSVKHTLISFGLRLRLKVATRTDIRRKVSVAHSNRLLYHWVVPLKTLVH